jgi:hypothetical protein
MNPDLSTAPEIAQLAGGRAGASSYAASSGTPVPTVGGMAALLRAAAARPARWLRLVSFDPGGQITRYVQTDQSCGMWLIVTPPGYRGGLQEQAAGEVLTLIAGSLVEHCLTLAGVARRQLCEGRIWVRGGHHWHETINPGNGFAVSLHVRPVPSGGKPGSVRQKVLKKDAGFYFVRYGSRL